MARKSPLKSKTNWVQLPFVGLLMAAVSMPDVERLICQDGKLILGVQILLTLIARNLGSNIRMRGEKED